MMFWMRFALRSCVRRRRRTAIILAGIAFAVASLIVLGAIMVGVNDTMIRNAVALREGDAAIFGGPLPMAEAIERANTLAAKADVSLLAALPRCSFPAIVKAGNDTRSTQLIVIDPAKEAFVYNRCVVITFFA